MPGQPRGCLQTGSQCTWHGAQPAGRRAAMAIGSRGRRTSSNHCQTVCGAASRSTFNFDICRSLPVTAQGRAQFRPLEQVPNWGNVHTLSIRLPSAPAQACAFRSRHPAATSVHRSWPVSLPPAHLPQCVPQKPAWCAYVWVWLLVGAACHTRMPQGIHKLHELLSTAYGRQAASQHPNRLTSATIGTMSEDGIPS